VPEGNWPAICYRFIDLGTQSTNFGDKRQVSLSWELKDDECVMREGPKAGQPMMISQTYTWSMHEKATLRKILESWRGKKFTDADFGPGGFDVRKLLGVPCLLQVVHENKGDKTFANVGSVAKPIKGMDVGELINPTVFISLEADEFDREAFAALPDRIREKIMNSPEYQRLAANGGGSGREGERGYAQEDEIPF